MIQKIWRGVLGRKKIVKFLRMRRRQRARDEQVEARLAMVKKTGFVVNGDEVNDSLAFKLKRESSEGTEYGCTGTRYGMESPGGSPSPTPGGSPVESRAQTPAAITFDSLDMEQAFGSKDPFEVTMTRTVSSQYLKTGVRHSLLLPVNGNTKGKLLSGKKLSILVDPPPGKILKEKNANNAVTWRDFYRPPVFYGAGTNDGPQTARSNSAPSLEVIDCSQSVQSLPPNIGSSNSDMKDPENFSRFLRSSLKF